MSARLAPDGASRRLPTSDAALHVAILIVVAAGYVAIRMVLAPAVGPVRGHATDMLAGIGLPSLFALLAPGNSDLERWIRTLYGKLALTAGAVIVWEGIVPLLDDRSTPDWLDILAYFAGTLVQHGLVRSIAHRTKARV